MQRGQTPLFFDADAQKPCDCLYRILNDRSFCHRAFSFLGVGESCCYRDFLIPPRAPPFESREWTNMKNRIRRVGGWKGGQWTFFVCSPFQLCPSHQTERAKGADGSQVSARERASVDQYFSCLKGKERGLHVAYAGKSFNRKSDFLPFVSFFFFKN